MPTTLNLKGFAGRFSGFSPKITLWDSWGYFFFNRRNPSSVANKPKNMNMRVHPAINLLYHANR